MFGVLGILAIVAGVLLILVVLVQNSKGGGLDQSNSMVSQIGNVAQSTDTVEKITWYLAAGIGAICLFAALMGNPSNGGGASEAESLNGGAPTGNTNTTLPQ